MNKVRVEWVRVDEALVCVRDYSCLSCYSTLFNSMSHYLVAPSFRSKHRIQAYIYILHSNHPPSKINGSLDNLSYELPPAAEPETEGQDAPTQRSLGYTFQGSFAGSRATLERTRKKRHFFTDTFSQKMRLRFGGHRKNLLPLLQEDGRLIFIYRTFDRKEKKIEVVAIEWLQSRSNGHAVSGCIPCDEDTNIPTHFKNALTETPMWLYSQRTYERLPNLRDINKDGNKALLVIRETGYAGKGLVAVTALRSGEVIVPRRLLELHTGVSMRCSCLGHR